MTLRESTLRHARTDARQIGPRIVTQPLRWKGIPGRRSQEPIVPDGEAVDQRRADAGVDQAGTGGVEEHVTGLGAIGERDRRVGQRLELPAGVECEAGLVRAGSVGIGAARGTQDVPFCTAPARAPFVVWRSVFVRGRV